MHTIAKQITLSILLLWTLILLSWFAAVGPVEANVVRGTEAPRLFRKVIACPSTHKFTGPCPGWVMDHLHSLRCGGADVPENLWWQTVDEAKLKDTQEDECWRYYKG